MNPWMLNLNNYTRSQTACFVLKLYLIIDLKEVHIIDVSAMQIECSKYTIFCDRLLAVKVGKFHLNN